MPFDLRITDGDLALPAFDLELNEPGAEAIAQRISITLRTFLGEYFLDTGFGTPWYQIVLRKGVDKRLIDTELKRVITLVKGVLQMISFESEINPRTRVYTAAFKVRVHDGTIDGVLTPDEITFRITEDGSFRVTEMSDNRIL